MSGLWPTYIVSGSVVLWTSTNLNAKWGYAASGDDNNVGSLADLYSFWFSCALDFDQLKCEVGIHGFGRRQQCRVFGRPFVVSGSVTYMRSGDSRLRMTTTKLRLRPTYTVPGSVVRWTSTSELRNFRTFEEL
ncbi:hypothetical protein V1477_012795 [Vespula maculifrons]|uniref:Uncharacterized protein n=1 Tax=Vespula maculifrons TaxID=7453 RepID=A0ABD2BU25_VESMC